MALCLSVESDDPPPVARRVGKEGPHPAYLRPYETGGWPIAPTSAAGGPQDLGYWIIMRLGAISKIQNALSYGFAAFWMVAKRGALRTADSELIPLEVGSPKPRRQPSLYSTSVGQRILSEIRMAIYTQRGTLAL
jgi:hypothetical protein